MTLWRGLGTASSYAATVQALQPSYCPSCPLPMVMALIQQESGGNPNAVGTNPNGTTDQGLFQINSSNFASLGITNPFDPTQSTQAGLTLLQQDYNQFGNWTEALEAYNEGPSALQKQIAAGVTPTSSGYASGILSAAGIDGSDISSISPVDSLDTSTLDDSEDDSSLSFPSVDLSDLTDLSSSTGVSWPILALGAVALIGVAYALA